MFTQIKNVRIIAGNPELSHFCPWTPTNG